MNLKFTNGVVRFYAFNSDGSYIQKDATNLSDYNESIWQQYDNLREHYCWSRFMGPPYAHCDCNGINYFLKALCETAVLLVIAYAVIKILMWLWKHHKTSKFSTEARATAKAQHEIAVMLDPNFSLTPDDLYMATMYQYTAPKRGEPSQLSSAQQRLVELGVMTKE